MSRFKLLRGIHVDIKTDRTYTPGDVIESDRDLTNKGRDRKKYERMPSIEPISETPDLDKMTVTALRSFAEDEGIDLGDAQLKSEIVETIQLACA